MTEMNLRGAEPRETADWPGTYQFEDDPEIAEGPCRVVDISAVGAGVELFGDTPIEPMSHRMVINVRGPFEGATDTIRVRGVVRYVILGTSGGVRVGIRFSDISDEERTILNTLEQIQGAGTGRERDSV